MSLDELNDFQSILNKNRYFLINSFLSSTYNRETALFFSGAPNYPIDCQIQSVLFEIEIKVLSSSQFIRRPFGDVTRFSDFGAAEDETLFMINSLFQLIDITYDLNQNVWIIKLALIDEDDTRLHITHVYLAVKNSHLSSRIIKTCDLLKDDSRLDLAKLFLKNLLNGLDPHDALIPACYVALGWIALSESKNLLAIKYQNKALAIYDKLDVNDYKDLIAMSYDCLATVCTQSNEYDNALIYYANAFAIAHDCITVDRGTVHNEYHSVVLVKIARTLKIQSKFLLAWDICKSLIRNNLTQNLYIQPELRIFNSIAAAGCENISICDPTVMSDNLSKCKLWKEYLDYTLIDILEFFNIIADGYALLGNSLLNQYTCIMYKQDKNELFTNYYNIAVDCFKKRSEILVGYAPNNYSHIITCYKNIAYLSEKMLQFDQSIEYYSKAADWFLDKPNDFMNTFDVCYKKVAHIFALKEDIEKQIEAYKKIVKRQRLHRSLLNTELSLADLIFNDFLKKPSTKLAANDKRYVIVIDLYKKAIDNLPIDNEQKTMKYCFEQIAIIQGRQNNPVVSDEWLDQIIDNYQTTSNKQDKIRCNLFYCYKEMLKFFESQSCSPGEAWCFVAQNYIFREDFCVFYQIACLYCKKKEYHLASEWCKKAIEVTKFIGLAEESLVRSIAYHYKEVNDIKTGIQFYLDCIEILNCTDKTEADIVAYWYKEIAILNEDINDYEGAIEYYLKAISFFEDQCNIGDKSRIDNGLYKINALFNSYTNIANIYKNKKNDIVLADKYFDFSMKFYQHCVDQAFGKLFLFVSASSGAFTIKLLD
ncbi:unnamed protein product [Adineta steineri]|uniref:TPR repeat-containing protein n=1 Tax=Adineta steineri TaxID=433720 RepID=A0A819I3G5_9BILA|nr:unnamed protein product [Adineta steineri]CAF3906836.1 unnamed protein product [Adineta steineri]